MGFNDTVPDGALYFGNGTTFAVHCQVNYPTLKLLGLSFQLQAKHGLTDDDRLVEAALDAIIFAALKSAFSM